MSPVKSHGINGKERGLQDKDTCTGDNHVSKCFQLQITENNLKWLCQQSLGLSLITGCSEKGWYQDLLSNSEISQKWLLSIFCSCIFSILFTSRLTVSVVPKWLLTFPSFISL